MLAGGSGSGDTLRARAGGRVAWDYGCSPFPSGPRFWSPLSYRHWTGKQGTWVPVAALPLGSPHSSGQACLPQSLRPLRRMRRARFTPLLCL